MEALPRTDVSSWRWPLGIFLGTIYAVTSDLLPLDSLWRWVLALALGITLASIPAFKAAIDRRPVEWRSISRDVILVPVMMLAGSAAAVLILSDWFQALIAPFPKISGDVIGAAFFVIAVIGFLVHIFIVEDVWKQLRNPLNLAFMAGALILLAGLFFIAQAIV